MLEEKLPHKDDTTQMGGPKRHGFSENDFIQVPSRISEKLDEAALSKEIDTLFSNLDI